MRTFVVSTENGTPRADSPEDEATDPTTCRVQDRLSTTTQVMSSCEVPVILRYDGSSPKGIDVVKIKGGKGFPSKLSISADNRKVIIAPSRTKSYITDIFRKDNTKKELSIDISIVDRIQRGQLTTSFIEGRGALFQADEEKSLSIIYNGGKETVDLMFVDVTDFETSIRTLTQLVERYNSAKQMVNADIVLVEQLWIELGKDFKEISLFPELMSMASSLSLGVDKKQFTKMYKNFCRSNVTGSSKDSGLTLFQTVELLQSVRAQSIKNSGETDPYLRIVKKIKSLPSNTTTDSVFDDQTEKTGETSKGGTSKASSSSDTITAEAFLRFLRFKQKEKRLNLSQVKEMFGRLNQLDPARNAAKPMKGDNISGSEFISRRLLESYLYSEENDAFDPLKAKVDRCDMSKPLSHYWINTSYRTYQIVDDTADVGSSGNNKGLQYMYALYRGCRCLEVDVWDGESKFGAEPVVCQHEPSKMNPEQVTLFTDVLKAIKLFLVSHPDSYPIILSIENHCSVKYQETMVSHAISILDYFLYTPRSMVGLLPSPQALQGKVVVRGKRPDVISEDMSSIMCDDFDRDNDFTPKEAADIKRLPDITDAADDSSVRSGFSTAFSLKSEVGGVNSFDIMSVYSDNLADQAEKSPEDLFRQAETEAGKAKAMSKRAEEKAFRIEVKANQAQEHVNKLIDKLNWSKAYLEEKMDIEKKKNFIDGNKIQGEVFETSLASGVEVNVPGFSSMDSTVGESGTGYRKDLNTAESAYSAVQIQAQEVQNVAAMALLDLQEATNTVFNAEEDVKRAEKEIQYAYEKAERSGSMARANCGHAEIALKRIGTVKELLQKYKDAHASAENVACTAATEAKISEERAEESEARAKKAEETAEKERRKADVETKEEDALENEAATIYKKYVSSANQVKSAREKIDTISQAIKKIDRNLHEIEMSSTYRSESKEKLRSPETVGKLMLTKHHDLTVEKTALSGKLSSALESHDSSDADHKKARTGFDEVTSKARQQAEMASIARRKADKSASMAERLAEQAEEEREAANLRVVASEKAELSAKRCESEVESMNEQLAEAQRAANESEELANVSKQQAEALAVDAVQASKDLVAEKETLNKEKIAEKAAQSKYEEAKKNKLEVDTKVRDAKFALERNREVYSLVKDQRAAKAYKENATRQLEQSVYVAYKHAEVLRKKAEKIRSTATREVKKAAEATAIMKQAMEYKKKKDKAKPISSRFAKLTLLTSTKYKYWGKSLALPHMHSHSIGEGMMIHLVDQGVPEWKKWMEFNKNHLTRTFPSEKIRKSSSNYNPMVPWAMGCQLVGMNIQSSSGMMLLVDGRFRENGSSGYVLKPDHLVNKMSVFNWGNEKAQTLRLRILGGNCLPKPEFSQKRRPSISPRVKVIMYDGIPGKGSVQHTTKAVSQNGFNPIWNDEGATFTVNNPGIAVVLFSVWERDEAENKDFFIAAAAIPVSCLREGYRSVSLYDTNRNKGGMYGLSSLLVEISLH